MFFLYLFKSSHSLPLYTVACHEICLWGNGTWLVLMVAVLVSALWFVVIFHHYCIIQISCITYLLTNIKLLHIYTSLLNWECKFCWESSSCHKNFWKELLYIKIIKVVKYQYALSGDALWNSVEQTFIAQEPFENLQTLHGSQMAC